MGNSNSGTSLSCGCAMGLRQELVASGPSARAREGGVGWPSLSGQHFTVHVQITPQRFLVYRLW